MLRGLLRGMHRKKNCARCARRLRGGKINDNYTEQNPVARPLRRTMQ